VLNPDLSARHDTTLSDEEPPICCLVTPDCRNSVSTTRRCSTFPCPSTSWSNVCYALLDGCRGVFGCPPRLAFGLLRIHLGLVAINLGMQFGLLGLKLGLFLCLKASDFCV